MTVAASIWSQLNIARTSAPPAASATDRGILIMTVALFTCLATVAVGGAPLAWKAAKAVWGRRGAGLRGPALLLTVGAAVELIVGPAFITVGAGLGPRPTQAWIRAWHQAS